MEVDFMGHDILMIVIGLVPGLVIGFFLARFYMKRYLKKNPPINKISQTMQLQ